MGVSRDLGASTGSRASTEPCSTVSALTGFDPERDGTEMLAILLWDFFGPHEPRTLWQIDARSFTASEEDILRYRVCANHIAESLRFYRGIEFPDAASAIEARSDETRSGSAEGESAAPKEDAR